VRSAAELVAELEYAARGVVHAAIIVADADVVDLVFYPDPDGLDPLIRLQDLMADGWKPIGLLRCARVIGYEALTYRINPFPGLGNDPQISKCLEKVAQLFERAADSLGGRTGMPRPALN